MNEYQANQLQLQQFYQQQRIMELQQVRQRQAEMQAQNAGMFTRARDQLYSAVTPMGGAPVMNQLGFGRNITQAGPTGVASQSLFGAAIDANSGFLSNTWLGYRAGFQFNMSQPQVQQRARQQLQVFSQQMGNVAMDAITPEWLQRRFGRVGMGDIQERALGMTDAFAGLRGVGSDNLSGRGIGLTRAARETELLTKALNRNYGGRLSGDEISQLQGAATAGLTSADIAGAGTGGPGKIAQLLEKMTSQLSQVAKNTGISTENLKAIVQDNRGMGNAFSDITSMSNVVGSSLTTTTANRERQLRTGLSMTAQGRQMNVANATAFGASQLQATNDLVDDFNSGAVSRAELFRYGGADSFDAASRVQQRRIQAGQGYAARSAGTQGVLGTGSGASLRGGFMGNISDISAAYARNPFAGQVAKFNYSSQQNLMSNASTNALQEARNQVEQIPGLDEASKDAMIKEIFQQKMGMDSPLDAAREVDMLKGRETIIRDRVRSSYGVPDFQRGDGFLSLPKQVGEFPTLSGSQEDAVVKRLQASMGELREAGISTLDATSPEVVKLLSENPEIGTDELKRKLSMKTGGGAFKERRLSLLKNDEFLQKIQGSDVTKILGLSELGTGFAKVGKGAVPLENVQRLKALLSPERLATTLAENKIDTDDLAEEIYKQSLTDEYKKDFVSADEVRDMLKDPEMRDKVMGKLTPEQFAYIREQAKAAFISKQEAVNLEGTKHGHHRLKPTYVEVVNQE